MKLFPKNHGKFQNFKTLINQNHKNCNPITWKSNKNSYKKSLVR